mmetsp:Transcript_87546/g.271082  ORF Transcript_87546/g.271082 Transcript_87546/m.271082 type:complete len:244 (+) Transcript_87546:145-876(+)
MHISAATVPPPPSGGSVLLLLGEEQLAEPLERIGVAVQEGGVADEADAKEEDRAHFQPKEVRRDGRGQDDGDGGAEVLQNVVGILDDCGDQEPPKAVVDYGRHRPAAVAHQHALSQRAVEVLGQQQMQQAGSDAICCQLRVPHPQGDCGVFEDLLRVDACKARKHSGREHRRQAGHGVPGRPRRGGCAGEVGGGRRRCRCRRSCGWQGLYQLHERHSRDEEHQCCPLADLQTPPQQADGQQGR